jgi:hypothetical protein
MENNSKEEEGENISFKVAGRASLQSPVAFVKDTPEMLERGEAHNSISETALALNTIERGGVSGIWRCLQKKLSDKRLADEWIRLALTATVFVCVAGLMTLAQMFSDRWFDMYSRNVMMQDEASSKGVVFNSTIAWSGMAAFSNNKTYATDPLFDHLSSILPDYSGLRGWLPDALLTSFLGLSLFITFGFMRYRRIRYQRLVVARRVLWILSLLYLFRTFSFLVTTVPSPIHNCVPKYPQDATSFLFFFGNMATGKITACTDNIYSGHTALATVFVFTNLIYSGRWYFALYSFIHTGALLIAIIVTRLHYSVDVLIALFMTSFVYCVYHFMLLIYIDEQLIPGKGRAPKDARWLGERRLLLRLAGDTPMQIIAWMDGMDLRTVIPEGPVLTPRMEIDQAAGIGIGGDDGGIGRNDGNAGRGNEGIGRDNGGMAIIRME